MKTFLDVVLVWMLLYECGHTSRVNKVTKLDIYCDDGAATCHIITFLNGSNSCQFSLFCSLQAPFLLKNYRPQGDSNSDHQSKHSNQ